MYACEPYSKITARQLMLDKKKSNADRQKKYIEENISRRRALQMGLAATAALAGCGSDDGSDGQTPPATEEEETDKHVVDIREYGAAVDGESDDTTAVVDAIEAAEPGDTVLFPSGTTVVSSRQGNGPLPEVNWGPAIYLDSSNSGVTLQGEGRDSRIQMAGGHPADDHSFVIQIDCENEVENVEVRDLTINGNRSKNPQYSVIGLTCWPGGAQNDVLVENVWAEYCPAIGIQLRAAGTRMNHCTTMNNGRHGINLSNKSAIQDPIVQATNVLSINNGGLGIDHNGGTATLDGFYLAGNQQGGMKFSRNATETTVKNGYFVANRTMGFRYNGSRPPDETIPVQMDNVIAKNNGYAGFWLSGNTSYDLGYVISEGNNISGQQEGNIEVRGRAEVSADDVVSSNASNGYGIYFHSEKETSIDRYIHLNNPMGAYSGAELYNLDIREELEERVIEPNMPDIDDLGADYDNIFVRV